MTQLLQHGNGLRGRGVRHRPHITTQEGFGQIGPVGSFQAVVGQIERVFRATACGTQQHGGVGAGVYDIVVEYGMPYAKIIVPVNFGSSPFEPNPPDGGGAVNRRAEIWMKSRDWLEDPAGVQIPDEDSIQADACGPGYKWDSQTRLILEKKDDMRRRGVPSPDEWDAVALTFAEPVKGSAADEEKRYRFSPGRSRSNSWMTA